MQGRWDEAYAMFHRVLSLRNDLGLLSEEYDPRAGRQVGNFPQAFSHLTQATRRSGLGEHGPIRRSSERKAEGKPPESQSVEREALEGAGRHAPSQMSNT